MLKGIFTCTQYAEESRRNGLYSGEESFPRLGSTVNLQKQAGFTKRGRRVSLHQFSRESA